MLTGYQCEVVAYALNGEYLCRDCATAATSSITIDKAERGLTTAYDISPLIRYELDEYNGERASDYVTSELGLTWEDDPDAYDKAHDDYPDECCGGCGTELG